MIDILEIKKRIRQKLIADTVKLMRNSGLKDKSSAFLLKSLHFHAPWNLILYAMVLPKSIAILTLFALFLALSTFFVLGGCFLTEAEDILGGGDINIVDPYIVLCKTEITNKTRYEYTLWGALLSFILVVSILHYREVL